jgi:hypothetical protein
MVSPTSPNRAVLPGLEDGPWTSVSADGDWLAGDLRSFSVPTPFQDGGSTPSVPMCSCRRSVTP